MNQENVSRKKMADDSDEEDLGRKMDNLSMSVAPFEEPTENRLMKEAVHENTILQDPIPPLLQEDGPSDTLSPTLTNSSRTDASSTLTTATTTSEAQRIWLLQELEIDPLLKTPVENADHLWMIKTPANVALISYYLGKR